MFSRILLGSLLITATGAACGGGSGGTDGPPGGSDAPPAADGAAPGPGLDQLMASPAAGVRIATRANGETGEVYSTSITAAFRASPAPTPYTEADRAGACARVTGALAFCDPPCEGDTVCTATDTCTPLAPAQSAGTLAIGDEELEPTGGLYVASAESALFAATDTITATAAGDAFPAFTSAPLAVPDPLTGVAYPGGLRAGEDYTISWTPAADTGSFVGVVLRTDLGHGPIAKSIIYCAVDDAAGTLTVPASMIDPHIDPANWSCGDCFPSWLYRFRSSTGADGVNVWFGQGVDVYAVPDRAAR